MERANFEGWAARTQGVTEEDDNKLWEHTEEKHPMCSWWWGRRIMGYKTGAYCYLCDKMVATWDGKFPPTVSAVRKVLEHRQKHLAGMKKGVFKVG